MVKSSTDTTDLGPVKSTHEEADKDWCCMPSTASFIQLSCLQETPMFSYFSYHTFKVCNMSVSLTEVMYINETVVYIH